MSKDTMISWCDSTLNLMMGCGGCELWNGARRSCYAGVMTAKYSGQKGWPSAFNSPQLFPHRLPEALAWPDLTGQDRPGKPWLNGMSRLIFLNDMGDTFTEELPLDWLRPHLLQMEESPHRWLILTKRPRRMRRFFEQVDRHRKHDSIVATVSSGLSIAAMAAGRSESFRKSFLGIGLFRRLHLAKNFGRLRRKKRRAGPDHTDENGKSEVRTGDFDVYMHSHYYSRDGASGVDAGGRGKEGIVGIVGKVGGL